ncbi:MAG: DUF664 domain-containing protein [Chloroflexi bacterium]|nr:DUF664 domain-containing protein [Chloroflexota bacterium]
MSIHPLVTQLRFARSEFARGLAGVTDEEARRRFLPMNCISWLVGHLANQEHRYWVELAQGQSVVAGLHELVGFGKPASTPPLDEMWDAWRATTAAADRYLETLTAEQLPTHFLRSGQPVAENIGAMLLRNTYHYWYHTGEAAAVRQLLGHTGLPDFVGNMAAVRF